MFVSLCEVIGHPEIVSDERFIGRERAKNVEAR